LKTSVQENIWTQEGWSVKISCWEWWTSRSTVNVSPATTLPYLFYGS